MDGVVYCSPPNVNQNGSFSFVIKFSGAELNDKKVGEIINYDSKHFRLHTLCRYNLN